MRRAFPLDEEDVKYLDAVGFQWETIQNGQEYWLLIYNFPIPQGYNTREAALAIQFASPMDYLRVGLDMAYFSPPLSRTDGKPIGQTAHHISLDERDFQRWSRHRTSQAPWDPGHDSLTTHLLLVHHWVAREFLKQ